MYVWYHRKENSNIHVVFCHSRVWRYDLQGSRHNVRTWIGSLTPAGRKTRRAAFSVPGASLTHLPYLFLFQFLFIVLTDYEKAMPGGYLLFPPFCSSPFFSKWVIVKQFMYSLSACVFIGGSELGLKPSPEVVFETWKEAPVAPSPSRSQSSPLFLGPPLSISFPFFLSHSITLAHTAWRSLSVSTVVT